jgi:hypothetical protein
MKINYLTHLNPLYYHGGGEMSMGTIIEAGKLRGHKIKITSAQPRMNDYYSSPDLWLLVDLYNCPTAPLHFDRNWLRKTILNEKLDKSLIGNIINNEKYIHCDRAYVDICNLAYLPCNGKISNGRCPVKVWYGGNHRCPKISRLKLYHNAIINIFSSPLHFQTIYNLLGEGVIKDKYICKPLIDIKQFSNMNMKRDIDNLYVGAITEGKGLENIKKMFPLGNVTLVGNLTSNKYMKYGHYIGSIPYERMPEIFNRAINFVFLPRWPEPSGRTVVEAALCGCNLICNENVGAQSFPFDLSEINNYQNATEELWLRIEQL